MRRAFTLVEMLVVMGIVVVLMGLLFPAVGGIQEESRSTACLNNLRQLSGVIEVYRQQNGSLLPNAEPLPAVTEAGPVGGLPDLLKGFIDRDSATWLCPSDDNPDSTITGTSYLYLPGLYALTPQVQLQLPPNVLELKPRERRELESRIVTGLYAGATGLGIPILLDSEERHFIGDRFPRNALFFDGSVRAAIKPPPNQSVD